MSDTIILSVKHDYLDQGYITTYLGEVNDTVTKMIGQSDLKPKNYLNQKGGFTILASEPHPDNYGDALIINNRMISYADCFHEFGTMIKPYESLKLDYADHKSQDKKPKRIDQGGDYTLFAISSDDLHNIDFNVLLSKLTHHVDELKTVAPHLKNSERTKKTASDSLAHTNKVFDDVSFIASVIPLCTLSGNQTALTYIHNGTVTVSAFQNDMHPLSESNYPSNWREACAIAMGYTPHLDHSIA